MSSTTTASVPSESVIDIAGDPVDGHIWIFGYGSLIWKPSFRHTATHHGFISGWKRRFWQGSRDHRGTPEKPGRVVTLIRAQPEDGEQDRVCHGMVYRVEAQDKLKVLAYLDFREQGGYSHVWMDVKLVDEKAPFREVKALVYMATEDNEDFLGYASEEEIAKQVAGCAGASGPNVEYVLRLAQGMHNLGVHDPHLVRLEALLHELSEVPRELLVAPAIVSSSLSSASLPADATSAVPHSAASSVSSASSSSGCRKPFSHINSQTAQQLHTLISSTSLSPTTLAFGAISRSFSFCSASLTPEAAEALARATSSAMQLGEPMAVDAEQDTSSPPATDAAHDLSPSSSTSPDHDSVSVSAPASSSSDVASSSLHSPMNGTPTGESGEAQTAPESVTVVASTDA